MTTFYCALGCGSFKTKAELDKHLEEHQVVNEAVKRMK